MQLKHIYFLLVAKNIFVSFVESYTTLDSLLSSVHYNASEMPQNIHFGKGMKAPLNITVNMKMENSATNFGDDDLQIDLKIRLRWYDRRLNYTDVDQQTYIFTKAGGKIWSPYLAFMTEGNFVTRKLYTYFRIYPESLIVQYVLATFKIKGWYSSGTFDKFFFGLLSLQHSEENLTLEWDQANPLEVENIFRNNGVEITMNAKFKAGACRMNLNQLSREYDVLHNCNCLEVYLENKALEPYPIIVVYLPGIVVVLISWACFWTEPSSILVRVAIFSTCFLHLLIQSVCISNDLLLMKNTGVLKSWLNGCLVFIFAAFLATTWITYSNRTAATSGITRLYSARTIQEEEEESIVESSAGEANTLCNHFHFPRIWLNRFPSTPDAINAICRVGFPLCFVIFLCAFFAAQY